MVSRHAAFYSPVIATIAGGFLAEQGLEATYSVLAPGQRSHVLIRDHAVDVMQSAVSSNWGPLERGESPLPVHFAQINQRDGFFLTGRHPDSDFEWKHLEGKTLLADHGPQPMAMLRYAASRNDVDWTRVHILDAGKPEEMIAVFRAGTGDYVHLQGPGPHTLEQDGAGRIVAAVGQAMPPVAFSSLCASREFLQTDVCRAFVRAFAKAKQWVLQAPPEVIAAKQASFFPGVEATVLAAAVRSYQVLECWEGGIEIPRDLYEQALNVFEHTAQIPRRYPYDAVCAPPPG